MAHKTGTISQPEDWWLAFKSQAKAEGLSLSEWIGKQCTKRLPKDVRDRLSEREGRGEWKRNS